MANPAESRFLPLMSIQISVVVPTCHRNDLLARCLRRLAPGVQTLAADSYEVLVTDDGTSQTAEAMVCAEFPWARWIAGPKRGPAANRNAGATAARGEWLAFTDDDCVPDLGWLAAYDGATSSGLTVYEGKTTCLERVRSPLEQSPLNLTGGWLWSCNMMIRRSAFVAVGRFDESFPRPHNEDTEFRERIKRLGVPFEFVPQAVVDHPPRRTPFGTKQAALHECDIVLCRKLGRPIPPLMQHLYTQAKNRVKYVTRHRLGIDSVVALASAAVELSVVAARYHHWVRRHPTLRSEDPLTSVTGRMVKLLSKGRR
jgi:glycosyltransferase involved in cell wall biosynthesis